MGIFFEEKGFILRDAENENSFCWTTSWLWVELYIIELFDFLMSVQGVNVYQIQYRCLSAYTYKNIL